MPVRFRKFDIQWFGYATVRIETPDEYVIYLDPGRYGVLEDYNAHDGDLVCVTHNHHYDSDGIERVAHEDATVVIYSEVTPDNISRAVAQIEELPYTTRIVDETESLTIDEVSIQTLPAYNNSDGPHTDAQGNPYHPKGFGVGYYLTINDFSILWPGDSDALDIHATFDVSLFLPPIGGSFTMDRREAASLTAMIEPELTLPIHYNTFEALETDANAFVTDVASHSHPVVLDES
ncbi:MAG: MBL fold metallo-hydrolase [Halobacteriaceae archaeon]